MEMFELFTTKKEQWQDSFVMIGNLEVLVKIKRGPGMVRPTPQDALLIEWFQ